MIRWLSLILQMPELRGRILFTLGMLAVFRLGVHIPAPGVDRQALAQFIETNRQSMFGMYDMLSGGALEQYSVFVLGIMPYITASIMVQVLTVAVPALERLSKEGQQGRNQITQYTRYGTIVVALLQSFSIAVSLENTSAGGVGGDLVLDPGWNFRLLTMITMTAGSCFVMWIGEQISERGLGNGSSLIITAGIVSRIPATAVDMVRQVQSGTVNLLEASLLVAVVLAVVAFICWMERGQRRIPIQYAKRVVGRPTNARQGTHLPLKVNTTGVIPPIFASSILMAPATLGAMTDNTIVRTLVATLSPGAWLYNYAYVGLIVFFGYFYTALMFNPVDVADNLRKHGGYIPGIRPGKQTAEYIDRILTRLTGAGSIYLAAVCVLPTLLSTVAGMPFYFGGTGVLIVVGVAMDTVAQVEAQLLAREYDGIQGPRSRVGGRRRLLVAGSSQEVL